MNEVEVDEITQQIVRRVGRVVEPVIATILECGHGEWYLRDKLLRPMGDDEVRNNQRVLKYAYNFKRSGAKVTFVKELSVPTADLQVALRGWTFYLEVRKFNFLLEGGTSNPAEKLIDAIKKKRHQLPNSEIGLVAIDNFDLHVESIPDEGFSHEHIFHGLEEVHRLARENPGGWRKPNGVIVAAHTSGGASSVWPPRIPHFIWVNPSAEPKAPPELLHLIRSSLPDGEIYQVDSYSNMTKT
jgi:hypothetical protein